MCITVCEADLAEKERKKQNQPKNQNEKKKKRKAESSQHASEYSKFFFFFLGIQTELCVSDSHRDHLYCSFNISL